MIWLLKLLPFLSRLSPVGALIKGNGKMVGVLVIVLALAANWVYIDRLQTNLERANSDKRHFSTWLGECQKINAKNQYTVRTLQAANSGLAQSVIVSEDVRLAAEEKAAERDRLAQIELDDTLTTLQELQNESLSCDELMQVDLGAVCPLTDQRLREHAAGTADY